MPDRGHRPGGHGVRIGQRRDHDPFQRRSYGRGSRRRSPVLRSVADPRRCLRVRRLQRIRTEFIDNLSHELRTPLTTISLLAETAAREAESATPRLRDRIAKIEVETGHLTQMVNEPARPVAHRERHAQLLLDDVDMIRLARSTADRLGCARPGCGAVNSPWNAALPDAAGKGRGPWALAMVARTCKLSRRKSASEAVISGGMKSRRNRSGLRCRFRGGRHAGIDMTACYWVRPHPRKKGRFGRRVQTLDDFEIASSALRNCFPSSMQRRGQRPRSEMPSISARASA